MNSDATDFVLPDPVRQAECINLALKRAAVECGGHGHSQHARHRHRLGRHSGMPGLKAGLARKRPHGVQQHQEFYRSRHGRGRGPGIGRQSALVHRRRLPSHDQPRPAGSRMHAAEPGCQPAARIGRSENHFEQFLRDVGNQFSRDCEKSLSNPERSEGSYKLGEGSLRILRFAQDYYGKINP